MGFLDTSSLTLSGRKLQQLSEIILKQSVQTGGVGEVDFVQDGVRNGDQILLASEMGAVGRLTGNCDLPTDENGIILTEKEWELKGFGGKIPFCMESEIDPKFQAFQRKQTENPNYYNTLNEPIGNFILSLITPAVVNSMKRIGWFSRKNMQSTDVTSGTDLAYLNGIDGAFTRLLTSTPSSNTLEITENSASTKVAQSAITPERAFAILNEMVSMITPEMRVADGALRIHTTGKIAEMYRSYLSQKGGNYDINAIRNGIGALAIDGIPIEVRYDWDHNIRKFFDLGDTWDKPNRVVLENRGNISFGTGLTSDSSFIKSYFDEPSDKMVFKYRYTLGSEVMLPEHVILAI